MKILNRIPLVVWALILSAVAALIVWGEKLPDLSSEQIRLLSGFLTFIGLIFVAVNLQRQWKNERIRTEYLNQPNFDIKGFKTRTIKGSGPVLCGNPTECTEDHWLNLIQTGNLAARHLHVGLFTQDEMTSDIMIEDRWRYSGRLGKDDDFEYKLPQFRIPFEFFKPHKRMCFVLLMDYTSEYSGMRYKRTYTLCATAVEDPKDPKPNDWKGRICFYNSSLVMTNDSKSNSVKNIFKNYWYKFARWSNIKKGVSESEWIIDI